MEIALSTVPRLSRLGSTLCAFSHVVFNWGAETARNEKDDIIQYLGVTLPALENSQWYLHDNDDIKRVQDLRRKLSAVLERLSDQSWMGRISAIRLAETYSLEDIRREVDATLGLVKLAHLQEGVDKLLSIHNGGEIIRTTSISMGGPALGAQNTNCRCGLRSFTVELPSSLHAQDSDDPCASAPGCSDRPPDKVQISSDIAEGAEAFSHILVTAFRNVEHHRLLVQTTGGHRLCLANSIYLLADLLKQAGRLREAVEFKQEAVELYLACDT